MDLGSSYRMDHNNAMLGFVETLDGTLNEFQMYLEMVVARDTALPRCDQSTEFQIRRAHSGRILSANQGAPIQRGLNGFTPASCRNPRENFLTTVGIILKCLDIIRGNRVCLNAFTNPCIGKSHRQLPKTAYAGCITGNGKASLECRSRC